MALHDQRALNLRGDPGLLSALGGAIKGLVTGGPIGAISGAISGFAPSKGTNVQTLPPPPMVPGLGGFPGGTSIPITNIPGVTGALQRALPGGATGLQAIIPAGYAGQKPSGFHLNKSGYWTAQGYVPPRSKWVRNRRRNLSNGRANTRALRRLAAWDKQERHLSKTMKAIARGR